VGVLQLLDVLDHDNAARAGIDDEAIRVSHIEGNNASRDPRRSTHLKESRSGYAGGRRSCVIDAHGASGCDGNYRQLQRTASTNLDDGFRRDIEFCLGAANVLYWDRTLGHLKLLKKENPPKRVGWLQQRYAR
jgi:hypothetical protein